MKMKAMVTKIDADRGVMVVLSKDRQFQRLPLPDTNIRLGDTIEIDTVNPVKSWYGFLNRGWIAAAVAVLVLATGLFGYSQVSAASTYVTLDMKSSLQLAVDSKGRVKSVRPLNQSAEELTRKLSLTKKDIYTAVEEVMRQASEEGFFHGDKDNLVVAGISQTAGAGRFKIDMNKLRLVMYGEMSSKHYPGYVVINDIEPALQHSAGEAGLSANKVTVLEKAGQKDLGMQAAMLKNMDMMDIISEHRSSVHELFPQTSYRVTWQGKAESWHGPGGTSRVTDGEPEDGGKYGNPDSPMPGGNTGMGMPGQSGETGMPRNGMNRPAHTEGTETEAGPESSHMTMPGQGSGSDEGGRAMMPGMP